MQEKAEKEARLREALEPKSIDDIRRERAIKKAEGIDCGTLWNLITEQ